MVFTEQLLAQLASPIAVVGNAKIGFPFGKWIDTYATVIRLNAFQIDGYEEWCGTRVTHWCTFGDTTTNPPLPRSHRRGLTPFSPFTRVAPESLNIKPHFSRRMTFAAKCRGRNLFLRPSTGLALLLMLEELGYSIDVFGFDGFRTAHYFDPQHRHDPIHSGLEFDFLCTRPAMRFFTLPIRSRRRSRFA